MTSSLKIVGLHKYLHYRQWFRRELAEYVNDVVNSARVQQNAFWNRRFLEKMATDHVEGRHNYVSEINAVVTLEAVERLLLHEARLAKKN
jgi:asparagine synthase (glutamine-hydrolysing)